jgi:hypothetical protein
MAKNIGAMAEVFQELTDEPLISEKEKQEITNISRLGELKPSKTISCVFNFDDDTFPIIADLYEQYFQVAQ